MEVHYKHVSPWLLHVFEQQPELVEPFTVSLECREPGVPDRETIKRDLLADTPDHLKKDKLEEFDFLDEMFAGMREQIRELSPKNAERILEEAKSGGFSLGKYFENVQFHISGEITDHGTSLLSQAVTGGEDVGKDVCLTAQRPFSAPRVSSRLRTAFQKSLTKTS